MKLTEIQIEELKLFTKKHFVEWIDLQMELVDHLANGIEEQWIKNSSLTFEECLEREFKKFGVFGFMDIVENRRRFLEKKYGKLIFQHFKDFFSFPKIVITISCLFILFIVFKNNFLGLRTKDLTMITVGISFLGIMIHSLLKFNNKKTENKWLYEEILLGKSRLFTIGYLPVQILSTLSNFQNDLANFVLAFLTISFSLLVYVMHFKIPSKVEQYLNENYPEYRFYRLKQ